VITVLVGLVSVCLLQTMVSPRLAIGGIQPDLFLIFVFGLSLTAGPELATAIGFLVGLYQDTLSGAPLGLNAFTLSLVGFLVSRLSRQLRTSQVTAQLALLLFAGLVSGLTTLLLLRFFQASRPIASSILWTVLPGAIYTATLGVGLLSIPRLRAIMRVRR
jgi:rod shape-determining protein MreD